jgi:hypothetical protein
MDLDLERGGRDLALLNEGDAIAVSFRDPSEAEFLLI